MTDIRTRIDAGRQVDLTAVHAALGHAVCGSGTEVVVADDDAPVTVEQLQAAVDAAPEDPTTAHGANRDQIRTQVANHLADLRTITGSSGSLTNAQLSNAARVLARGQVRLIRLALDLYDDVD